MDFSKRTFTLLITGTLLVLLYVHTQIAIFQLSYSIGKKEREVAQLSETYKTARFRVARLRSPQALSQRAKKISLVLIPPKNQEVIKILRPRTVPIQKQVVWPAPFQFLSLIHFVKEAHAKTSKG